MLENTWSSNSKYDFSSERAIYESDIQELKKQNRFLGNRLNEKNKEIEELREENLKLRELLKSYL